MSDQNQSPVQPQWSGDSPPGDHATGIGGSPGTSPLSGSAPDGQPPSGGPGIPPRAPVDPPPAYPGEPGYPLQSFVPEPAGYPPSGHHPGFAPQVQHEGFPSPVERPAVAPERPNLRGIPLADWPKRALGGLIDYIAPATLIWVVLGLVPSEAARAALSSLLGLAWAAYLGYQSGTTGVTLGRSVAKTKLVSEATGEPVDVTVGILRQLAHFIDTVICFLGWFFPLWDGKRQTIADRLVKTVVIDNSADPDAGEHTWWP